MEPCFKKEDLWALVEEARGVNPKGAMEGLLTPEETERLTGIPCPFCEQKTLKFAGHIGPMGEAMFRCENCTFMAGIENLTEKDRAKAVLPFIQSLLAAHERAKKEMNRIEDILEYLKP